MPAAIPNATSPIVSRLTGTKSCCFMVHLRSPINGSEAVHDFARFEASAGLTLWDQGRSTSSDVSYYRSCCSEKALFERTVPETRPWRLHTGLRSRSECAAGSYGQAGVQKERPDRRPYLPKSEEVVPKRE